MPKIIVTSTFRKGGGAGKKGGAGGLLKYMGTREGVEKLPLSQANAPATKRQKALVESVIMRIPETVQYPEYQEFLKAETIIGMIFANMPSSLDKLSIAKYLYISIAKLLSYDINLEENKNENYNLSLVNTINN